MQFALLDVRHINLNEKVITLTHGHLYDKYHLPEYCGNIFLSGHTHYGTCLLYTSWIIRNIVKNYEGIINLEENKKMNEGFAIDIVLNAMAREV